MINQIFSIFTASFNLLETFSLIFKVQGLSERGSQAKILRNLGKLFVCLKNEVLFQALHSEYQKIISNFVFERFKSFILVLRLSMFLVLNPLGMHQLL